MTPGQQLKSALTALEVRYVAERADLEKRINALQKTCAHASEHHTDVETGIYVTWTCGWCGKALGIEHADP
jgi:hypothetical protein